jgi:hypothetical protein
VLLFGGGVLADSNRSTADSNDQDRQAQPGPSIYQEPQHDTRVEDSARSQMHRCPRIAPLPLDSKDQPCGRLHAQFLH